MRFKDELLALADIQMFGGQVGQGREGAVTAADNAVAKLAGPLVRCRDSGGRGQHADTDAALQLGR